MTDQILSGDGYFFISAGSICRRSPVSCHPDIKMTDAARLMKQHNISGIVAVENDLPVGIISLRDMRNMVADSFEMLPDIKVRDIMKTTLVTIRRGDLLFKALFLMAKHNIHRLVVVDEFGRLSGMITDTDLLKLQTRSPLYLIHEIESAASLEQLKAIGLKMPAMLQYAIQTRSDPQSLIQLIAHFNDAFTHRLIHILEESHGVRLPEGAAFLSLGSEGRQEQTLRTDQDNAIVYRDDLPAKQIAEVRRFAEQVVTALESVGVPLCPGNMMASNPDWCHSLSEWKRMTTRWINSPTQESMVFFGVFQDLRVLWGDHSFEVELQRHICEQTKECLIFFPNMARNIIRFKPPLGMFNRLQTEKGGINRGKLDIKKGGIFALTRGIALIALESGMMGGTTWDKLFRLNELELISHHELDMLSEAFTFLIQMRLTNHMDAVAKGVTPSDYLDPRKLKDREREHLVEAFRGVEMMIQLLRSRYQLDLVAG